MTEDQTRKLSEIADQEPGRFAEAVRQQWLTLPEHERVTALTKAIGRALYIRAAMPESLPDREVWDSLTDDDRHVIVTRMHRDVVNFTTDILCLCGALCESAHPLANAALHDGFIEYIACVREDEANPAPEV